jgi:colanic acid/amylovoran biosynthesis glycosyltransferase
MHICYVLGTFPTTSETFVSDEIISCVKAGHKVTIARIYQGNAVNHANVEWIKSNVKIIDIKPPANATDSLKFLISACVIQKSVNPILSLLTHHPRWAMTAMLPTFKQLGHENFDHIHAHFADKQVLFANALSVLLKVPFSFTMHGYDIRDLPIGKDNLLRVINAAKCAFTVSAANISALKLIGANTSKFDIIPCGIDTSKFATPSKPYTEGQLVIACVARLHPIKNHKTLLQALSMLDNNINFHLKIIGDGELNEELKSFVKEDLNLRHKVSFLGSLSSEQVLDELLLSHVHVLPSFNEGMPVANTEAMASGLICITSQVGGLPEVIQTGRNGFLFNPNKPEELATIIEAIYLKKVATENISNSARSDALTMFDQQALMTRKIYKLSAGVK